MNELKDSVDEITKLKEKIADNIELLDIIEDDELTSISDEINSIKEELSSLHNLLMLSGPYDKNDCIIDIHPGAGGTESCDWASMLYRMYTRYCERKGFKITVLNYEDGEEAGIKSVSIEVKGHNAYGYLKNEKGVHRLVRLSPFDSNHRRHTSFASLEVTPIIETDNDIEINLPTKIVVTCQNERSQIQNKEEALKVLKNKLLALKIEEEEQKMNEIKGETKEINFGSQIRSYVMHPYSMVKDHRTNTETSNVDKVLDGDIDMFIEDNLKNNIK